jgi:uncharacterized membrane protein
MWLVFLHIAAMFIAYGLTAGVGIFSNQVFRSGDVRAIRAMAGPANTLTAVGGALLLIGVLLGLAAAITLGYPLSSRWLVIAYVLVAYIILDGIFVQRLWRQQIAAAAASSGDSQPSDELRQLLNSKLHVNGGILSGLAYLAAIVMMTIKP